MTTTQKNEWIASEERFQKLFKENSEHKNTAILSQLTFCSDGVIIKKYSATNAQDGIAFQVFNESIEEVKANKSSILVNERELLEVKEFGMDEMESYVIEGDFKKGMLTI
ncbi:MAG: hypothetical protein ABI295_05170 [Xanthomarina sp.]